MAVITYPDTKTQIPSHYSFTYTLMGNVINDEFDNVNPDEVNAATDEGVANAGSSDEGATDVIVPPSSASSSVVITSLDKKAEYIVIKTRGTTYRNGRTAKTSLNNLVFSSVVAIGNC